MCIYRYTYNAYFCSFCVCITHTNTHIATTALYSVLMLLRDSDMTHKEYE